jgi:hypothetical protein
MVGQACTRFPTHVRPTTSIDAGQRPISSESLFSYCTKRSGRASTLQPEGQRVEGEEQDCLPAPRGETSASQTSPRTIECCGCMTSTGRDPGRWSA